MPRIELSDIVGRDAAAGNRLPDTLKLKLGLERLGYYEPDERGFTPGADDGLWYGLESYQRDRGLDVDGVALPDGPTVSALNDELDQAPPVSLITGKFDAPLSPEAAASNRRTVRALQSFRGVGDLPAFAVSALRAGDPSAAVEVADLLRQSYQDAPAQADKLRGALAEYMTHDDLARLDTAVRGAGGAGEAVQLAQASSGLRDTVTNRKPSPQPALTPDLEAALEAYDVSPEFTDKIAGIETNGQPNNGWGTTHYNEEGVPAYGRYQMTSGALKDAKLIGDDGGWTGKYGIKSAEDFLDNPKAQEAAFRDFLKENEQRLQKHIGTNIKGVKADITVDDAALMAALHRAGPTKVGNYFAWLASVGGNSRDNYAKMDDWNRKVETRLREFQGCRSGKLDRDRDVECRPLRFDDLSHRGVGNPFRPGPKCHLQPRERYHHLPRPSVRSQRREYYLSALSPDPRQRLGQSAFFRRAERYG